MSKHNVENTSSESTAISREETLMSIAKELCEARAKTEVSIDDAANTLKLRKIYLQALESGDWKAMPDEVYALGFLKQYAAYLGLDMEESIQKLKSGKFEFTKPLTFPDPPIAPAKTWALAAVLAFVIIFIVVNVFNQDSAPLPSQLMQNQAEKTLQSQDSLTLSNTLEHESMEKSDQVNTPQNIADKQAKENPSTTVTKAITSYTYQLKAVNEDVWLQLHQAGEPPVLVREALLKKGETMSITHPTPLVLNTGNALALEVTLNGKIIVAAGSLGKKGKVLRGYLLQEK